MSNFEVKLVGLIFGLTGAFCPNVRVFSQKLYHSSKMAESITAAQAHTLLSDKSKRLGKKALGYLHSEEGYILKNNDVVIKVGTGYQLMPSSEFIKLLYEREAVFTRNHSLEEILASEKDNLDLFRKFFYKHEYDFSVESLEFIDRDLIGLQKKGVSEADLFLPIVCYVGGVLLKKTQGRWAFSKGQGPQTEVIVIIGKNGKVYDPYVCIRKILANGNKNFSLYSAIDIQLAD